MNIFKIFSIMGSAGKSAQIIRKFKSGEGVLRWKGMEDWKEIYIIYIVLSLSGEPTCVQFSKYLLSAHNVLTTL